MKNIEAKISSFSADGYFLCIWYVFTPGYENIPPFRLYFAVTLNRCLFSKRLSLGKLNRPNPQIVIDNHQINMIPVCTKVSCKSCIIQKGKFLTALYHGTLGFVLSMYRST